MHTIYVAHLAPHVLRKYIFWCLSRMALMPAEIEDLKLCRYQFKVSVSFNM